jgi:beta-1,4-mannooligosaccharide/beta-1,4-mannosyl-N-acetylglucosamine phosphorylase
VGDVPNVAFPCDLDTEPTGCIAIYYGGADMVTARAFAKVDEVLDFVKPASER